MIERSDAEMLARLVERSRLLIALSDEIPVETKLETQPLLKQMDELMAADLPDADRVRATHMLLVAELAEFADLDALLSAMEHFLP